MKYLFTFLFALFLPIMSIIDYRFDKYNSLSMIIIILAGIIILCMRRQIVVIENDALKGVDDHE